MDCYLLGLTQLRFFQRSGSTERDNPYRCTRISRNRDESGNWSQKGYISSAPKEMVSEVTGFIFYLLGNVYVTSGGKDI